MKKTSYLSILVLLCAVSVAFSMGGGGGSSSSKTFRGFEGKIKDENGKALKDVEITLLQVEKAQVEQAKSSSESESQKMLSTKSGGNGRYRFIAVRPGYYRVRYSMNGYQTIEKLMEFKRGGKDAVLDVQLHKTEVASGGQN